MKKQLFVIAAAVMTVAACSEEKLTNDEPNLNILENAVEITAYYDASPAVKVASDDATGKLSWQDGDEIGVWTGSKFAKFTLKSTESDGKGIFAGSLEDGETVGTVAIYPYNPSATDGTGATYNLPAEIDFIAGNAAIPMLATGATDGEFYFKQVGGLLKVSYSQVSANARKIMITADAEISGNFNIDGDALGSVASDGDFIKYVNLEDYFSGRIISGRDVTFYVPVPPATYSLLYVAQVDGAGTEISGTARTSTKDLEVIRAHRIDLPKINNVLAKDIVYDFEDAANLGAPTSGEPLILHGEGFEQVEGPSSGNKAIRIPTSSWVQMVTGFNGDYATSNAQQSYTISMLVKWPSSNTFVQLVNMNQFMRDPENTGSTDFNVSADEWSYNSLGAGGVGSAATNDWEKRGNFLSRENWHWITIVGTASESENSNKVDVYQDGDLVWTIGPGCEYDIADRETRFFPHGDMEFFGRGMRQNIDVARLCVSEGALTSGEIYSKHYKGLKRIDNSIAEVVAISDSTGRNTAVDPLLYLDWNTWETDWNAWRTAVETEMSASVAERGAYAIDGSSIETSVRYAKSEVENQQIYVVIDYGSTQNFAAFMFGNRQGNGENPKHINFYVSDDPVSGFVKVGEIDRVACRPDEGGCRHWLELPNAVAGRYVKVEVTASFDNPNIADVIAYVKED